MRTPKFNVGDMIRIKSYETMLEQYESYGDGSILENDVYFVKEMSYLCGIEAEVLDIDCDDKYICYEIDHRIQRGWMIEEYMVELAPAEDVLGDISHDDFMNIIF